MVGAAAVSTVAASSATRTARRAARAAVIGRGRDVLVSQHPAMRCHDASCQDATTSYTVFAHPVP